MLIQQARDLHVRMRFACIDILSECTETLLLCMVCLCGVSALSTVDGQLSRISCSDQGRSGSGRLRICACAYTRTIINLYTICGKCHMIAESAQPRNPSPDPFRVVGGVWGRL